MLILSESAYRLLRRHAETAYPNECCGVLTGTRSGGGASVMQAVALTNVSATPRNRYEIDPLELVRILKEAQRTEQEVVGFYHSHPDHPAHWSATDLAEAHWLGCLYVITSVEEGMAAATCSFLLAGSAEEDKRFEPVAIEVRDL